MPDELRNRMADETNVPTELVDSVIDAYRSGIDRTLIRRNLGLSVQERFEQLMSLQKLADELRAAGNERLKRLIEVKRAAGRPKDLEVIAELEAILEERNR